jgi:hypothetical protein
MKEWGWESRETASSKGKGQDADVGAWVSEDKYYALKNLTKSPILFWLSD